MRADGSHHARRRICSLQKLEELNSSNTWRVIHVTCEGLNSENSKAIFIWGHEQLSAPTKNVTSPKRNNKRINLLRIATLTLG